MSWQIHVCPCCGGDRFEARGAMLAGFVAARAMNEAPRTCRLCRCFECGVLFYDHRLAEDEIKRLYDGYRGEAYFAARHRWEPFYTRATNDSLGGGDEIAWRRQIYHRTLAPWAVGDAKLDSVLDYGGDRGQLIVEGPGRHHYVYEISGRNALDGVTLIDNEAGLIGRKFDLVLACHLLEHMSEPFAGLVQIAGHVRTQGLLYLEVPFDRPRFEDIPRGTWYTSYLNVLSKSDRAVILAGLLGDAFLGRIGRMPPIGFYKAHEHLQHFDLKSLRMLIERAKLELLCCEQHAARGIVTALARVP